MCTVMRGSLILIIKNELRIISSYTLGCEMKFGVYVPLIADERSVPMLIFLSERQANEQSFITKSGMQRLASKYGFIVANSDTYPRMNTCRFSFLISTFFIRLK